MSEINNIKSKKKKLMFYTVTLLLIIVLPFIIGEILVRVLSPEGIVTPEITYNKSLEYVPSSFTRHISPRKERIVEWNDSTTIHMNKLGYRGKEFSVTKQEGTIRIIFLGGSHVFNANSYMGEDWPHLTEKYLNESGFKNVECINAGVPGYASFDALGLLYSEIHNFNPDYIVVCNTWNDIKYFRILSNKNTLLRTFKPISGENPYMYYNSWLDKFLCNSQLYVRLRWRYYSHSLMGIGKDLLERIGLEGEKPKGNYSSEYGQFGLRQYKLNLETIVDVSRNIGAIPILLTQARLVSENNDEEDKVKIRCDYQLLNHEAILRAFNECDQVVREIAREKNVNLIDLSSNYSGQSDLFRDHVHLSSKGSKTVAQYTSLELSKILNMNNTYLSENKD